MTLRVTNTLSGEREPFEPIDDTVLIYLCGLTTSDPAHLGHARTWVHTDVMHRWLEHLGYDVRHVENVTDVNEKIVARVGEVGDDEAEVAEHYVDEFLGVMRALNLERVDVYPRVTEHVPEIIDLVETLVEEGYAYESNGSVYFDVTTFDGYGALSNQDLAAMEAQGQDEELGDKRRPEDFALWKAGGVAPGEVEEHRHEGAAPAAAACETAMTFDSPWGEGRPGWHVECSAMSMTHLGETFDVHVAGRDLVFPHNENEVAQSEAATGDRFARYWLHTGMLRTGGDEGDAEKMSSSLMNYFEAADAVEAYGADVLRTFYLSTVYSADQAFTEDAVAEAEERYERLERAHERAVAAADSVDAHTKVEAEALRAAVAATRESFTDAMNDDFNTREALAALLELATAVNSHADAHDEYDYQGLAGAVEVFETFGDVFGLTLGGEETGGDVELVEDLVELVLAVREEEREAGNYDRADDLRDRVEALGVEVQDTDDGPTFRR
jgi:cysteinyl-tRNA synthetase